MAKAVATRSATTHFVFGTVCPMKKTQLPQCIDVLRHYYFLKSKSLKQRTSPADFYKDIVDELVEIWESASIPTIDKKGIDSRLRILFTSTNFTNIDGNRNRNLGDEVYIRQKQTEFTLHFLKGNLRLFKLVAAKEK